MRQQPGSLTKTFANVPEYVSLTDNVALTILDIYMQLFLSFSPNLFSFFLFIFAVGKEKKKKAMYNKIFADG